MAINTLQRRGSLLDLTLPWRQWLAVPTGSGLDTEQERVSALKLSSFSQNWFDISTPDTAGMTPVDTTSSTIGVSNVQRRGSLLLLTLPWRQWLSVPSGSDLEIEAERESVLKLASFAAKWDDQDTPTTAPMASIDTTQAPAWTTIPDTQSPNWAVVNNG